MPSELRVFTLFTSPLLSAVLYLSAQTNSTTLKSPSGALENFSRDSN